MINFIKLIFTSSSSGKFSATKTVLVLNWILSFAFLVLMIIMKYAFGKALDDNIIEYAKIIFGVGTPISLLGYLGNRINELKNGKGEAG